LNQQQQALQQSLQVSHDLLIYSFWHVHMAATTEPHLQVAQATNLVPQLARGMTVVPASFSRPVLRGLLGRLPQEPQELDRRCCDRELLPLLLVPCASKVACALAPLEVCLLLIQALALQRSEAGVGDCLDWSLLVMEVPFRLGLPPWEWEVTARPDAVLLLSELLVVETRLHVGLSPLWELSDRPGVVLKLQELLVIEQPKYVKLSPRHLW
jgi:hypothetical protein